MGSLQDFIQSIQCWIICKNKCYTIIKFFVSYLQQNSSLPILFFQILNKHDPLCIYVLLTIVLIAQNGYYIFLLFSKVC